MQQIGNYLSIISTANEVQPGTTIKRTIPSSKTELKFYREPSQISEIITASEHKSRNHTDIVKSLRVQEAIY